jgi:Ca2+-transporting ATPase
MASESGVPGNAWSVDTAQLCRELGVRAESGLPSEEARRRLARFGPNQLRATLPRPAWKILLDQFRSIVIGLLCAAAILAIWYGDIAEGLAVGAVILINASIGFLTELRATRSMEALARLGHFETRVRRDDQLVVVSADSLVPGDIVALEGGDVVSADLRLLEASALLADESALTGESEPVDKRTETLANDTPLMERSNLLHKGTRLARGSGLGVVIGTGYQTELGRIAQLVGQAEAQETPLEKRLDALGRRLVWVMLLIAALTAGAGVITGRDTLLAIQVAVALMVAAIPEGLPIVATIALARGMWRMARRNALIIRLSAVETLGATGIILTDKTGTLTENRMAVREILLPGHELQFPSEAQAHASPLMEQGRPPDTGVRELATRLLEAGVLCNNASLPAPGSERSPAAGDPMEIALLAAARLLGIEHETCRQAKPRLREDPFTAETRAMAVFNRDTGAIRVSVKGAPESILPRCTNLLRVDGVETMTPGEREAWLSRVAAKAEQGYRILALAMRQADSQDAEPYEGLTLLGVACFQDPPRDDVRETIERCRAAGIDLIMVTGDHVATARHIATEVGLLDANAGPEASVDARNVGNDRAEIARLANAKVIARVSPQQKFALVRHFQDQGRIVAMTGDGVNDAPALKQADIGVAMGIRGTAVAREAAAMVLQDDRLSTIVEAIQQGRAIYSNIRKFVIYLLSCNISEVLIVALATLAGAPLPLLPLQILFLNLVTDVFPALALGVSEGHQALMQHAPRNPEEHIVARRHWLRITIHGVILCGVVLGAMACAIGVMHLSEREAITISFCTLALAQLWHVFNMRDRSSGLLRNEITENPWVWAAIGICLVLMAGAIYLAPVSEILELQAPTPAGWALIGFASLLPLLAGPLALRLTPEPEARPGEHPVR